MNGSDAFESVVEGRAELSDETALRILKLPEADIAPVFEAADRLNERLNGRRVSFIHNMNINYTNICEYFCSFCEFGKSKSNPHTYILNADDIRERMGAKTVSEITFQGGLSDRVKFDEVLALMCAIKRFRPDVHLHAFSPEEIHYYAREKGLSYRETIGLAQRSGMDSMCGTAAEILDDEVREQICPTKIRTDTWLEIVRTAHQLGLRSTATIMFGHVEEPAHVVRHLARIRDLQKQTGGFTEFIQLLFMPDKTRLGRRVRAIDRRFYARKLIALARLYFSTTIRNIQTSWVKLGLAEALACLEIGANDMGGTLYSENITREAGGQNGEYTSLETFYDEIARRGKIPVLRDTLYTHQHAEAAEFVA